MSKNPESKSERSSCLARLRAEIFHAALGQRCNFLRNPKGKMSLKKGASPAGSYVFSRASVRAGQVYARAQRGLSARVEEVTDDTECWTAVLQMFSEEARANPICCLSCMADTRMVSIPTFRTVGAADLLSLATDQSKWWEKGKNKE